MAIGLPWGPRLIGASAIDAELARRCLNTLPPAYRVAGISAPLQVRGIDLNFPPVSGACGRIVQVLAGTSAPPVLLVRDKVYPIGMSWAPTLVGRIHELLAEEVVVLFDLRVFYADHDCHLAAAKHKDRISAFVRLRMADFNLLVAQLDDLNLRRLGQREAVD